MSLQKNSEINKIQEEKNYFVKKWIKELVKKIKRDKLLDSGLMCTDFGAYDVFVEYEDGSSVFYRNAFIVKNKKETAIFTEHNGYCELKNEYINHIEEQNSNDDSNFSIKLKKSGKVQIKYLKNNKKITLNKDELSKLQSELNIFAYFKR